MNKRNILVRGLILAILILFIGQIIFPAVYAETNEKLRVKIFSDDTNQLIQLLEENNFDVIGSNRNEGFVEIITSNLE